MAYKIGLIGAGRIGRVHAASIAGNARAKLVCVVDQIASSAESLAHQYGATTGTLEKVLGSGIDAVMICSATNTHADLIERAAAAGKAIFCEKPVDLDVARARSCAKRAADPSTSGDIVVIFSFPDHYVSLVMLEPEAPGHRDRLTVLAEKLGQFDRAAEVLARAADLPVTVSSSPRATR